MSFAMFCKTTKGELEEVNELVFNHRESIVDGDKRRYTDEYFFVQGEQIEAHGTMDRNTFALLGRSLGLKTETSARMTECPEFVFIKQRKGMKNRLMHTTTGEIYKS